MRHRKLCVLRGSADATRAAALDRVESDDLDLVWIGGSGGSSGEQDRVATLEPGRVRAALGRSVDGLILDGHGGLDPEILGQCHGLVRGGGRMVLRLDPPGTRPSDAVLARFAAAPYGPEAVGGRFYARLEQALARARTCPPGPFEAPPRALPAEATVEQAALVAELVGLWRVGQASRAAVIADRGRGKSSALGLALAELLARVEGGQDPGLRVAVCAAHRDALGELLRFACGGPNGLLDHGAIVYRTLPELVFGGERFDLILVDEAAQLPVPMLRSLVEAHADAQLCFSTTTHGYEGTGRGFALRFLTGLERGPVPVARFELSRPIRWDPGDPLEAFVFDALLLDAEPAAVDEGARGPVEFETSRVDRDALVADEADLRELFGLLVHAHYRTTPSDLQRLLDAPNLAVHVVRMRGADLEPGADPGRAKIVAACLVAEEGQLDEVTCEALVSGDSRIRAHALAEVLVSHLGKVEAGGLAMIRSVRIATHPDLRRQGLAARLVEHVHRSTSPDLFGTLFGAAPELLAFRRSLGYELVRVSASRGARTGEPAVMMVRPVSARARALVAELRHELARDLPRQLELFAAEGETLLAPELLASLTHALPEPAALTLADALVLVRAYAHGPRTFESVAVALARVFEVEAWRLDGLDTQARALIEARILGGLSWDATRARAGLETIPAAMRGLRRAVRAAVDSSPAR